MGLLKALNFPKSLIKATPALASCSSVLAAGACRQSPGSPACWPPGPPLVMCPVAISGSRGSVDRRQRLGVDVRQLVPGSVHEGATMPRRPVRRRGSGRSASAGPVLWGRGGCHSLGRSRRLAGKGWDAAT